MKQQKSTFLTHVPEYRIFYIILIAAFFVVGAFVVGVKAQVGTGTVRVASFGTDVTGCGSVATPCKTLQYAVDMAPIGGSLTILMTDGTYTYNGSGTTQTGREVVRILGKRITIKGGYTTSFTTANPDTNVTTIDGQSARRAVTVESTNGTGASLNLSGVTLTNGNAPQDSGTLNSFGGALDAYDSTITLSNVKVTNNVAKGLDNGSGEPGRAGGGGLSFRQCTASLSNVELTNNTARGGDGSGSAPRGGLGVGGALFAIGDYYSKDCSISLSNVTATRNTAKGGDAPGSYGIYDDVQRADGLGGGISLIDCGNPTLSNVTLDNNTAQGGTARNYGGLGLGGGLFFERAGGTVYLSDSQISNNQGIGGIASTTEGGAGLGGGIFSTESQLTVERTALLSNIAQGVAGGTEGGDGSGGGIYIDSAASGIANRLDATNIVVGDNMAAAGSGATNGFAFGGGIYLQNPASSSSVTGIVNHLTMVNNAVNNGAHDLGAGLFVNENANAESNFGIFTGHTSAAAVRVSNYGTATFNHTLWDGNIEKTNLGRYGSFNETFPYTGSPDYKDPTGSPPDYHITKTSAAIDKAGDSSTATDVDGQSRPYQPSSGAGTRDLGADEYYPSFLLASRVIDNSTIELAWGPSEEAGLAEYQVEYSHAPAANDASEGASPVSVPGGSVTQAYRLTNLTTDQPYVFTLVAYNGNSQEIDRSNVVVSTPANLKYVYLPLVLK